MAAGQERTLRRRIRSVEATKKITRAMELIAASQITRAQNRIAGSRPYQAALSVALAEAARDAGHGRTRALGTPESPQAVGIVVIVSDRGLCGGYNAGVLRATERHIGFLEARGVPCRLVTVGKKAQGYFRFRNQPVDKAFTNMTDRPTYADAVRVATTFVDAFEGGELDLVELCSTRFVSAGAQVVEIRQVLPLPESVTGTDAGDGTGDADAGGGLRGLSEFEPDAESLLGALLPQYAEAQVYGALLEASASEHTARQRAMAAATENAEELIKTLVRQMNRIRQDAITTEIMEIVGGAEALRQAAARGKE